MPDSLLPFAARQTSDGVASLVSPITVGNSTVEGVLLAYAVPANSMIAGTTYDLSCSGFGASTAQNLTLRLRWGGLAGVVLATIIVAAAATTSPSGFWIEGTVTCRTPGNAAVLSAQAICLNELATVMPNPVKLSETGAPVTALDTTTQKDLVLTAQWAAVAAGATLTASNGLVLLAKA